MPGTGHPPTCCRQLVTNAQQQLSLGNSLSAHSTTGAYSHDLAGISRRGFNGEKELTKMLDMVIGTIVALIAATLAVFLILLAINIALVRKLRSIIPLSPDAGPAAERLRARGSEKASDKPQSAGRSG
jgi:hypothetical protein